MYFLNWGRGAKSGVNVIVTLNRFHSWQYQALLDESKIYEPGFQYAEYLRHLVPQQSDVAQDGQPGAYPTDQEGYELTPGTEHLIVYLCIGKEYAISTLDDQLAYLFEHSSFHPVLNYTFPPLQVVLLLIRKAAAVALWVTLHPHRVLPTTITGK